MIKVTLMLASTIIFLHTSPSYVFDIEYIRKNYHKAQNDANFCREMTQQLSKEPGTVYLAYLGAFQAIWAHHTVNPLGKLNSFNEGRKKIEAALKIEPNNIEIRFVRYSIQKNAPSFLNYRKNIVEDRKFLNEHKNTVEAQSLRVLINNVLNT